jgi:tryptophan 2,3-dioxygenase
MLTYSEYLKIDEILALQSLRTDPPEHDEMLFIIIHQTYELWFKQLLHETRFLMDRMQADDLTRSSHVMKRILKIMKTLVGQVDILETMTPLEFESFRHRLDSSSGFQSYQFRAFEFLLGYKREQPLSFQPEGSVGRALLEACMQTPSVWQMFLRLLSQRGFDIPNAELNRNVVDATQPNDEVQKVLIRLYRENDPLAELCELLVDLDEGLQEWRYRHVKMVQRTIGAKMGSGGSSGAAYLQQTLFKPVFPDLWEIRSAL